MSKQPMQFCNPSSPDKQALADAGSLHKADNLFHLLMDQTEDEVLILDAKGLIVDINRFAAESRGLAIADWVGKSYEALDPSFSASEAETACAFNLARKSGKRAEGTITIPAPNGRLRYIRTFCYPVYDRHKKPSYFLFIRRDITAQKQLEQRLQQSEKMAFIGELSTYMAHEIRNPLFSIGGFANALLRDSSLTDNARGKAKIIFEEARRLDNILTNILNFARPTEQEFLIFDVEDIIRQTIAIMSMGSDKHGITTHIKIEENLPQINGNPENLKQCLINLAKNSFEAMENTGTLLIDAKCSNGYVQIMVEDTGKGIAPELQGLVFSPFFSTKGEGAGLGLAMTRKIIEEMGGEVNLSSVLGKGTTLTLSLPAALAC